MPLAQTRGGHLGEDHAVSRGRGVHVGQKWDWIWASVGHCIETSYLYKFVKMLWTNVIKAQIFFLGGTIGFSAGWYGQEVVMVLGEK